MSPQPDIKIETGSSGPAFTDYKVLSLKGDFVFAYNPLNYYMRLGAETSFSGQDMTIWTAALFDIGLPLPMVVVVFADKDENVDLGVFYPEGKTLKSYVLLVNKGDKQAKYSLLLNSFSKITIVKSSDPTVKRFMVVGVSNDPFPKISSISYYLDIKPDSKVLTPVSTSTSRL